MVFMTKFCCMFDSQLLTDSPPVKGIDLDIADPFNFVEDGMEAALEEHGKVWTTSFKLELAIDETFRKRVDFLALLWRERCTNVSEQVQTGFNIYHDIEEHVIVAAIMIGPECEGAHIVHEGSFESNVTVTSE